MTSKKFGNERSRPLERVARKALRQISAMKLARGHGDNTLPAVTDLTRAEDALVNATTDAALRVAISAALEIISTPDLAELKRALH